MIATAVVVLACAVEAHAQLPVRTRDLRLFSNNNVNYVSHTAPNGLLTNTVYTWPTALPSTNGQVLSGTTAGQLSWISLGNFWALGGNSVPSEQTLGTTSTFDLPIITNNVERMRILSTGEVGIGATPAAARLLDVNGTAGTANVRLRSTGGAAIATVYTPTANDGIIVADANGDLLKRSVGSVLGSTAWLLGGNAVTSVQNLGTTSTFDLPIITNNVERMRILSTGEVGIGATPAAARLLDVNGTAGTANVRLRSTGGAAIATVYTPTANDGIIVADANGDLLKRSVGSVLGSTAWLLGGNAVTSVQNLGTTSAFALPIITNNAERMRILSTGEVGIGTPTPTTNARLTIATIPATGGRGIDVDMASTTTSSGLVVRGIGASGANDAGILVGTTTAGTGIGMRMGTVAGFNAPDLGIDIQAASNGVIVTPTTAGTGTAFRASTSAGTRGRRAFEGYVRGTAGNVAYGLSSDANAIAGGTGLGAYLSTSGTTGTLYPLVVASENNRNIYLGSTTADTPADLATILTGTSNQSTTYMFNARMSGGATLVGSTSGTVTFVAPATIATSHTYTMPSATGTAGQVLRIATSPAPTASAATLEWGAAAGSEIFEEVTAGQGNVRRKLAYTNGIAGAPVGQYAIDLQAARGAATQTASGQYSALVGGSSNTVSGAYAFIGAGLSNTASNSYASVLGGQANSVSGTHATILGGQSNTVSGNHSMAFGYGAAVTQNNTIVFNHPTVGAGATRVGIGNNNPTVSLDVDGGVVIRPPANLAVTGNNQTVTVGNRSYIVLDPGGADRTGLVLSAGSNAGQILILRILETAGNYIQLPDAAGSNVNLTGNWTGRADDTIMLIWTGANWAETSRSNN